MSLASKLLRFLNRAFDKDPAGFLALRLQYDGLMVWRVADGFLTTRVSGGSGAALSIDLSLYTIRQLAGFLAVQPGYSVPFVADGDGGAAAALRLVEGTGTPSDSNGDHLVAYASILYAWVAAQAQELELARTAITGLASEMSTTTADGGWLDYQGSFYRVQRGQGEQDRAYGARIIAEVLRPAGNNVALEAAIRTLTGQSATIQDVVFFRAPQPRFDGTPKFDGTYHFQPTVQPVYGLFDAVVGYDLLGGDVPTSFVTAIRSVVEKLRDAGTQLRSVSLTGSALSDHAPLPSDDADSLTIFNAVRFDGTRNFDGRVFFAGATASAGTLGGGDQVVVSPLNNGLPLTVLVGGVEVNIQFRGWDAVTYGLGVPYDPLRV